MFATEGGLRNFKPSAQTEQAMTIRRALPKKFEAIRADRSLSDQGKRQQMALAMLEARTKLDQLRVAETTRRAERRAQLEAQLFGVGTDPLSRSDYRDALDRAEREDKLTGALRLQQRAQRLQDSTLAKAVAAVAVERAGWDVILDRYVAAAGPGAQSALDELRSIDAGTADATQQLGRSAVYTPPMPPELRGVAASDLARIAQPPGPTDATRA